jgi:serine/threonine-protein kinase
MPFQQFGRYEVKSELGRGGMATVYLGYDPRFRREVAIKVLPREFLHDPQFRARFEREAQTIALLDHPAIVPVHDFGEDDGLPYLVMRLMTGGSLATRLKQGPLSIVEASRILNRLALALDKAHARGIIHRDLKPGNILFDGDGEPYLSDFGIVKLTEATASFTGSALIGTPAYMSPEQVRGDAKIDGRSDVYAFGVILFEMLTGKQPYEATTPIGVAFKHVTDPIPRILDFNPSLPLDAQAAIERAMAKAPEDRFQTAGGMAAALAAIAGREAALPKTVEAEEIPLATTEHARSGETAPAEPEPETREPLPAPAPPLTAPPVIPEAVAAPPGPVVAPMVGLPETETAPLEAPVAEAVALPPEAGTPAQAASLAEAAPEASENLSGLPDLTGLGLAETEARPVAPPAQPALRRAPRPLARFALPVASVAVIVLLIVGGAIFGPGFFSTSAATPTEMSAAIVESSPSPTRTISPTPTLTSTPTVTPTRTSQPTITPTSPPAWVSDFAEPILAAIANRTPDFQDDFSTRAGGWKLEEWCAIRGRLEIKNGEMTVADCRVWREMWYPDFVAEFDARFLLEAPPDNYWSFVYRDPLVVGPGNFYMFYFSGDVNAALLGSDGVVRHMPNLQGVALPGTNVNHILVIAKGQDFALYINDQPVFYKRGEPVWPNGGMRLNVGGVTVVFDNFKIWDISDLSLPATPTPRPTATTTSAAASPDTGTVEGRIMWGNEPFSGVIVKLCTKWLFKCETAEYSAVSDAEGNYTITGIPPGDYYFMTKTPDQKDETRWRDEVPPEPWVIKVVARQTVTMDDVHVWKHDLLLISPAHGATASSKTPTLSWKAYPGAAEYDVAMECPMGGGKGGHKFGITTTQWTVDFVLYSGDNCDWQITARAASGQALAVSPGYRRFIVP